MRRSWPANAQGISWAAVGMLRTGRERRGVQTEKGRSQAPLPARPSIHHPGCDGGSAAKPPCKSDSACRPLRATSTPAGDLHGNVCTEHDCDGPKQWSVLDYPSRPSLDKEGGKKSPGDRVVMPRLRCLLPLPPYRREVSWDVTQTAWGSQQLSAHISLATPRTAHPGLSLGGCRWLKMP